MLLCTERLRTLLHQRATREINRTLENARRMETRLSKPSVLPQHV